MTWLTIESEPGASDLEAVLALRPGAGEALASLLAATRASVDADLFEPMVVRAAHVLDVAPALVVELIGLSPSALAERLDQLRTWPTTPELSDRQRVAVAHAEQFIIDQAGITDTDIARLLDHLEPDELFRFQVAVGVVERALRFCRIFEVDPARTVVA